MVKLKIDMSMITQQNEVLGFFEGFMDFKELPTKGENNILFDDYAGDLSSEISRCLKQEQVLENLTVYDVPRKNGVVGICFMSFFYIPSIEYKDIFIKYFKDHYGFYFNDFSWGNE